MLERMKDFLYDISDIAVSLLIIAVIFFSVSWKISDTLSFDLDATLPTNTSETTPAETSSDDERVIEIIPNTDTASDTDQGTSADTPTENVDSPANNPTTPAETTPATASPTTSTPTTSTPAASTTLQTFTVSAGASGYSIGQQLASEGYIDSANTFVNRLVERELDRKLFAGDFKLSKSDDLDTIISVLTGQDR